MRMYVDRRTAVGLQVDRGHGQLNLLPKIARAQTLQLERVSVHKIVLERVAEQAASVSLIVGCDVERDEVVCLQSHVPWLKL
jgi:hypothetical protein